MRKTLTVRKDFNSGEIGFAFDDMKINDDLFMVSTDPILLAHDYCEHVNGIGQIGTIHDELEALGGIYFVRGWDGMLRRDRQGMWSFEENIAADISRMYGETGYVPFIELRMQKSRRHDYDEEFKECCAIAKATIVSERDRYGDEYDEKKLNSYLAQTLLRMRIGYRKANKRYKGDRMAAVNLFWNIYRAFERERPEYEGQRYELIVTGQNARVDEIYEY